MYLPIVHSQLFPLGFIFDSSVVVELIPKPVLFSMRPGLSSSAYIDDLNISLPPLGMEFPLQVHGQPVILNSLTETAYFLTYLYLFR